MKASRERAERLQIMLSAEELAALDEFRFTHRMPSRASAVREVLRRGLVALSPTLIERSPSPSCDPTAAFELTPSTKAALAAVGRVVKTADGYRLAG